MGCWTRSAQALLIGVSTIALMKAGAVSCAYAQSAEPAGATVTLDPVTVVATKTRQRVSDTLAPVSTVRATPVQAPQPAPQQTPGGPAAGGPPAPGGQLRSTTPVGPGLLQQLMPTRTADVFFGMPGVWTQTRGDEPGTAINIRGLQDFGRVAVLIDGARQNFQRSGHNADGQFYLDPEMIGGVDVVRGPVANIYGSGAIGGVVSFRTKDIEDVVRAGERWGVLTTGMVGSNILKGMGSVFAGAHVTPDIDIFGGAVYRTQTNYRDGDGKEWPNTGSNVASGIGKLTIRPADGHEVKFTGLTYETTYLNGQPTATLVNTATIYDTRVQNDVAAARWRYSRPDDQLFDFDANVYWTRTATDQQKISGTGNAITGFIGDKRRFAIDTNGFDINNTSRADWGPVHHALTYGGDSFQDQVSVTDPTGTGDLFTPNGRRTVSGNFVQLRTTYAPWIETIIASRYDTYKLDGGGFTSSGERTSPKATLGVTPLRGFTVYGTYAEGYRAPAVTETLIAGNHPPVGGPPFGFLPNPLLRPEVGKNKEVGVNLRYDDIATKGDAFRGKFNYYRNDLSDFIELTFIAPPCLPHGGFLLPIPQHPERAHRRLGVRYQLRRRLFLSGICRQPRPRAQHHHRRSALEDSAGPVRHHGRCALPRPQADPRGALARGQCQARAGHPEQRRHHRQSGPAADQLVQSRQSLCRLSADAGRHLGAVGRKPAQRAICSLSECLCERQQRVAVPEPRHHRQRVVGGPSGWARRTIEGCAHHQVMRQRQSAG